MGEKCAASLPVQKQLADGQEALEVRKPGRAISRLGSWPLQGPAVCCPWLEGYCGGRGTQITAASISQLRGFPPFARATAAGPHPALPPRG